MSVFVCTNEYTLNFLQLFLCYKEILLEKYPVWQLIVSSSLVFKQNFLNTKVIVNYHILIICNWSGYGYMNFCSNWQFLQDVCILYDMNFHTQNFIIEKYVYFCDILIKIKLHTHSVQPEIHLDVVIQEGEIISQIFQKLN